MAEPVLPTILLVEDTPSDATLIRRSFEKTNVLNPIVWTKNGQEALAYLSGLGQQRSEQVSFARADSAGP